MNNEGASGADGYGHGAPEDGANGTNGASSPITANYYRNEGRFDAGLDDADLPNNKMYGLNASLRQLHYSENKVILDNSINKIINIIYELISENKSRPIYYPTATNLINLERSLKSFEKEKMRDDGAFDDFKILKLNLNLNPSNLDNEINNLDQTSIAKLFESKLNQQIKSLLNLKDRIDDTSSKVLITGDLNAGKSSFCNSLLRRKILPEDQQPCTLIFCEIIDACKENNSIEEVHAIPLNTTYDIRDETTYEIFGLNKLEDLVGQADKYQYLKVYINDIRPKKQSLLNNGVIDIRLIDGPGLNMDSYQTTQVFSRQEEIDLVVFVVNSENHFTLSGKDFISSAANEKQYLFVVSNKFDNIKDKNRCKDKILQQVKTLSPDTYKDSENFVHFLSSNHEFPGPDDDPDGGSDDEPEDDSIDPDFDKLEASLRKFVLEKRAVSKLLPAKTFLINLLRDIHKISVTNQQQHLQEKENLLQTLRENIQPNYDNFLKKSLTINDNLLKMIEQTCTDTYTFTKDELNDTFKNLGDSQIIPYMGLQYVYEYGQETQRRMIQSILSTTTKCEGYTKEVTSKKVEEIIKFGKETLGDEFLNDKRFQSDKMFKKLKDLNILYTPIEVSDFFDPSLENCLAFIGLPNEWVSHGAETLSNYNPTSIITKLPLKAITLREQLPTQLTLQTLYSTSKILTAGTLARKLYSMSYLLSPAVLRKIALPTLAVISGFTVYYLINDIPNAFPRKQARKLRAKIEEIDYVHSSSDRVSKECRKVLNYPLRQVMNNFQTSIDKRNQEKVNFENKIGNCNMSLAYFTGLLEKIDQEQQLLDINLEINTVE